MSDGQEKQRWRIVVEYDGTDFSGWQRQDGQRTVQSVIENAIRDMAGESVFVRAAGRTDAGVHAVGQVANFFTDSKLAGEVLIRAVNDHLPDDVVITKAEDVPEAFDATRHATSKLPDVSSSGRLRGANHSKRTVPSGHAAVAASTASMRRSGPQQ